MPNYPTAWYTWITFKANGVTFGYYVFARYGLTFGVGNQSRMCGVYLGNQYEYYYVRNGVWAYLQTTNCDTLNNCQVVRRAA